jgi:DNA repair exonuclease SbcCD ATPase subunit
MRKERNQIDPAKPALILTYGSCPGKVQPLDREVLVIGRAPSCDLVLNSPEVSPVHCLLIRTRDGWLLRNTNPRVGTQLNGEAVQDVRLADDDSLQIGTFSFKVHLPPTADSKPVAVAAPVANAAPSEAALPGTKTRRLLASRQRLVRLAWTLRRRLHQHRAMARVEKQSMAQREAELDQRTVAVDARQRECENLLSLLEEQEDEVNDRRQEVLAAAAALEASRREAEQEVARQVAAAEAHILSARHHEPNTAPEMLRELEARKAELDAFARHLQEQRQGADAELDAQRAENEALRRRLAELERDAPDRVNLDAPEAVPDAELDALRGQLETLRAEYEAARLRLADLERDLGDKARLEKESAVHAEELAYLRDKLQAAREELKRLEDQDAGRQAEGVADSDVLRAENGQLQQRLAVAAEEKARLQARLEEQWRELIPLRDRARALEEELRRSRTAGAPTDHREHAELVTAVETLLAENEEFRQRLLSQSETLKAADGLEQRVQALQAEADSLRSRLQVQMEKATDPTIRLPGEGVGKEPASAIHPDRYLRTENEELKARLAAQEAALLERERLVGLSEALQLEVATLRVRLYGRTEEPPMGDPSPELGWRELIASAGTESLLKENDALRDRLAEQQSRLAEANRLRVELEALRTEAGTNGAAASPPLADDERERLTARIAELEGEVRQRDDRIAELQDELTNLKGEVHYDNRVALQQERLALEEERAALERELANLRDDREELDAAGQAAELQAAQERGQITREWAELTRKREEFQLELEKGKRDNIRENLDRVRRIKEEVQGKRDGSLASQVAQRIGERRKIEPAKAPE